VEPEERATTDARGAEACNGVDKHTVDVDEVIDQWAGDLVELEPAGVQPRVLQFGDDAGGERVDDAAVAVVVRHLQRSGIG
jgi:hypothetical protein